MSEPVPPNPVLDEAIKRAVIAGNFEAAVDCCVKFGRMADAMLLAATGGRELFQKTQERYFELMKHQSFMKITVGGHVHVHVRVHVLMYAQPLVKSCDVHRHVKQHGMRILAPTACLST